MEKALTFTVVGKEFGDEVRQKVVTSLKERWDFFVMLSHFGFDQSLWLSDLP